MKLYVVEDTYQYDGGSNLHGIFDDPNQALVLQQTLRKERAHSWGLYREGLEDWRRRQIDQGCEAIGIREVTLNETL